MSRGSNDGGTPDPVVLYGQGTRRHSLVSGWGAGPDLVERRGHVSGARRYIAVEGLDGDSGPDLLTRARPLFRGIRAYSGGASDIGASSR